MYGSYRIIRKLNPAFDPHQSLKLHSKAGIVPGLVEIKVNCENILASSNADVMLDSTLESVEALHGYAVHPAHVAAANTFVRPFTDVRLCLDYEVKQYGSQITSDVFFSAGQTA